MKKTKKNEYGRPLLLYPGMSLRIGSMVQILDPIEKEKESVDKHVDKHVLMGGMQRNSRIRPLCLKNRH
jgi:hypothetical protein